MELPPRARRIQPGGLVKAKKIGTTSACAENTVTKQQEPPLTRNYLRVRGEYMRPKALGTSSQELPPRARRIPQFALHILRKLGTTSACAENTPPSSVAKPNDRNYLRVRGEYSS